MHRPILRWLLFTLCLAVFASALVWISGRMLAMENERREAERSAQIQERVRLALWRMESIASTLLIRENARPASHYQAFYSPTDLYTTGNKPIPEGEALTPSPLLGEKPDLVRLHFEVLDGLSTVCSPQVPEGKNAALANNWYVIDPKTAASSADLKKLESILRKRSDLRNITAASAGVQASRSSAPVDQVQAAPQPQMAKKDSVDPSIAMAQQVANNREFQQRSNLINQYIAAGKSEAMKVPMKKVADVETAAEAAKPSAPRQATSSFNSLRSAAGSVSIEEAVADAAPISSSPPKPQELPSLAGDLSASWIDGELFLFRNARLEGQSRLQGIWLDWPSLQQRLLETIRDLLPAATLRPATEAERTDPDTLVTLPIKFSHGPVAIALPEMHRPILRTLAIAWASLLLAAAAIAFVLQRALTLSERRGAFVSAVTHELRTPLTTFQLYSEMLAEDMVTDPAKRKDYLNTLHSESGRLMHLVENVLSFSRIERGRTAAREETLTARDLLDRMLPRLRQRASSCGLTLQIQRSPEADETRLKVDPLAAEQILSNLVDNACKYAAPASSQPTLDLHLQRIGRQLHLSLRDYGPGLPKAQRMKLFQPFTKSASEAAHSAPGVGLGLALSKRLARELGGDLRYDPPTDDGTRFVLTLPAL